MGRTVHINVYDNLRVSELDCSFQKSLVVLQKTQQFFIRTQEILSAVRKIYMDLDIV